MVRQLLNWPRDTLAGAALRSLTPEDLQQFLELEPHLLDDLLALADIGASFFAA